MKIITGGKKDYYDYLIGRNGIDTTLVFDRTKYTPINSHYDYLFKKECSMNSHNKKEYNEFRNSSSYFLGYGHGSTRREYDIVLEIGFTQYLFKIDLWEREDLIKVDYKLLSVNEDCKKISTEAIGIIFTPIYKDGNYYKHGGRGVGNTAIDGVILKDTWIPSIISAERVYRDLYEYFTKLKEPKFTDTRSDIQKLEAHGFDKKISFRNIK